MLSTIRQLLFVLLVAVFAVKINVAQSSSGGGVIQGTVKDGTGAVIPDAKVAIRHLTTGRIINSLSNSEGFFVSPPLAIGKYKVRVMALGMKAWEGDRKSVV